MRFASDGDSSPKVKGKSPLLTAMIHGVAPVLIEYGGSGVPKLPKKGQKRPAALMLEGPFVMREVASGAFLLCGRKPLLCCGDVSQSPHL